MRLTLFERALSKISPRAARNRALQRNAFESLRKYDAASRKKRNKGWFGSPSDKDSEIKTDILTLRSRARDLYNNNPYAKRIVDVLVTNHIGTGIFADFDNKKIEKFYKKWTKQLDYYGEMNFSQLQALMFEQMVRDGECLIIRRRASSKDGLEVPLQIQVLDCDFLAYEKEEKLKNGNYISMGVEYNQFGKIVAYHIYKSLDKGSPYHRETKRYLKKDVIHLYKKERIHQSRGVPWLHAVMQKLRDFDSADDAMLVKIKLSSCYMAFIKKPEIQDEMENEEEEKDEDYTLEPGTTKELAPGMDVVFPNLPTVDGISEFSKKQLHAIATGANLNYWQLTNDLSDANYSSMRGGWIEFNRYVKYNYTTLLFPAYSVIIDWFLEALIPFGLDGEYDYKFTPPRRELIDPVKEIPALKTAIRSGIMSWQEVQRSQGNDPQLVATEIKKSNEIFDKYELTLDSDPRKTQQNGSVQKEQTETKQDDQGMNDETESDE